MAMALGGLDLRAFDVEPETLPAGDYVSPGLVVIRPDACFPHMRPGNVADNDWAYLRREIGHGWYVDERAPTMGFIGRDEAVLLHNIALGFAGYRALEVGSWFGWSTAHLALGGVILDVVDPVLADPVHRASIEQSLSCCGVRERVTLHAAESPGPLESIATANGEPWSLAFVDGDHEGFAPAHDVEAALPFMAPDCAFVFHDLASPHVAEALALLESHGFNILLYQTMQIMGFAWRGRIAPVQHVPDPKVVWQLPHHLVGFPVSGAALGGHSVAFRRRVADLAARSAALEHELADVRRATAAERDILQDQIAAQQDEIRELRTVRSLARRGKRRLLRLLRTGR